MLGSAPRFQWLKGIYTSWFVVITSHFRLQAHSFFRAQFEVPDFAITWIWPLRMHFEWRVTYSHTMGTASVIPPRTYLFQAKSLAPVMEKGVTALRGVPRLCHGMTTSCWTQDVLRNFRLSHCDVLWCDEWWDVPWSSFGMYVTTNNKCTALHRSGSVTSPCTESGQSLRRTQHHRQLRDSAPQSSSGLYGHLEMYVNLTDGVCSLPWFYRRKIWSNCSMNNWIVQEGSNWNRCWIN